MHWVQADKIFSLDLSCPTFCELQKKIDDMVVNNWKHVTIDRMVSKPKIIGCPDLRFEVGEL